MDIATLHKLFLICNGACTDTRAIIPGSMFFALKGPNFNANSLAAKAIDQGCKYAVVDEKEFATNEHLILVDDVLIALQVLARFHRQQFNIPVIGITGSNGKTTTKELMHAVLNSRSPTLATIGNLNNHIGVPLTLLRLNQEHEVAIIEMGANKLGDIAELCAIALPDQGLITNIGRAHLEGFGGLAGVIKTKCELYDHLRKNHHPVYVNADDALLMERTKGMERLTYASAKNANVTGSAKAEGPFLTVNWTSSNGSASANTKLIGGYNLANALAAICVGEHLGVDNIKIQRALSTYVPANNRSQWKDTGRNELIMDAYNANPTSVCAALEDLAASRSSKKKLAILGDMFELGEESAAEHSAIVGLIKELGLSSMLVGPMFKAAAAEDLTSFSTTDEAIAALKSDPIEGYCILVKGSRGMKLEKLFELL